MNRRSRTARARAVSRGPAVAIPNQSPLRPYQADSVVNGVAHYQEHQRGQLVAAPGAGKTRIALHMAHELTATFVGVTVPNIRLAPQWAKAAADFHRDDPRGAPRFLVICSEPTVAASVPGMDALVTTDPTVVRRALKSALADEQAAAQVGDMVSPLYVLCTNHSTPVLAAAMATTHIRPFDFLIGDEAHRTCGDDVASAFRTIVLPDGAPGAIRATRRLFLSATPKDRPTPVVLPNRARLLQLTEADQTTLGVEQLEIVPLLDGLEHERRYKRGQWILPQSHPCPDGSLVMVRPLIPRPFVDPDPTMPHEIVHIVVDEQGRLDLTHPNVASSLIVPALDAAPPVLRGVKAAEGRAEALSPTQSLAGLVETFHQRATAAYYMDDRSLYGHIIADVPEKVVAAGRYIAPYRVLLLAVAKRDVLQLAASVPAATEGDRRQIAAIALGLSRAGDAYGMRHAMAFHQGIAEAEALAIVLESDALAAVNRAAGVTTSPQINAESIHSRQSDREQDRRLERFASRAAAGTMRCLSAVRIGTEGQDIPAVDTIAFAAPRESPIEVVQIKGRASRLDAGRPEKVATILLPVVVDDTVDVRRTGIDDAIDPYSRGIARGVMAALLTADEAAFERIQLDALTACPTAPGVVALRPEATDHVAGSGAGAEIRDRSLRAVAQSFRRELAGVAPRRYSGVSFDREAGRHRVYVAHTPPNARDDVGPLVYVDRHVDLASVGGYAVDRVLDEQGLDGLQHRNFARPFSPAPSKRESTYRGVVSVRGAGRDDQPTHAAIYELRRLGGSRTGAVTIRYAQTEDDAARIADALMLRYNDRARSTLNFPGEAPRHDLAARTPLNRDPGVEYDAAVKRWWAYATYPAAAEGPPLSVSLGFYASERDAQTALRHTDVAFRQVPPQQADYARLSRIARQAVDEAGVVQLPLPTEAPSERGELEDSDAMAAATPRARTRRVQAAPARVPVLPGAPRSQAAQV